MDAILPRHELPEAWTGKGACPVCRTRGRLSVVHQAAAPDQLWCAACDAAFEVESDGAHLRLMRLPASSVTAPPELLQQWVLPSELAARLAASPSPTAPTETPAAVTPRQAEVRELLYGPETTSPVAPPPEPPLAAQAAVALLAAVSAPPAPPLESAPAAEADSLAPESAALLSALLNEPPSPAVSAADAGFIDAPAAVALETASEAVSEADGEAAPDAAPTDSVMPAAPLDQGDAAALLAQLLDELPAAQPSEPEAAFLDALAGGVSPAAADSASTPAGAVPEVGLAPAASQAVAGPAVIVIPATPPEPTELAARARQLYQFGNSLAHIQAALERTGASAEQVAAAMREVRALDQQRRTRHTRTYHWLAGAGLLLVLLLIGAAAFSTLLSGPSAPAGPTGTLGPTITPGGPTLTPTLAYNPIIALINLVMPSDVKIVNGNTPTPGPSPEWLGALFPPTATPAPATATAQAATAQALVETAAAKSTAEHVEDGVPDWIKALVPDGITVVGVPTPAVHASGPPRSNCPLTAELAAALFGGTAANWSYDSENNGWFMTLIDTPTSVRVPANMSAGYLVLGETFEFRNVHGPATLDNINFIAISCDL
ncbi:MAG: hypothetical protein IT317_10530 [Anaerolineales bacterium]|nr:hypothetical protein [Anaerolineales bacterium]